MDLINWLQELGKDADPSRPGFQPSGLYLLVCVVMPVVIGASVGMGLRLIERVLGIELGRGRH
jgi:hypothetical protein